MANGDVYADILTGYWTQVEFDANPTIVLGRGQRIDLDQTGTYKLGDGVTTLVNLPWLGGSVETGTIQYITSAASATPEDTDIMVSVSDLNQDFLLNAPPENTDAKEFKLRVKALGVFQLAFDIIYRFSNDLPAVSQTSQDSTLYFSFIKNSVDGTWDCIGIEDKFGETIIPPPPYVAPSVSLIENLDQFVNDGPSNASIGVAVYALGLDGGIGDGDITMSIPSPFEASEDNGVTWSTNDILIHYEEGKVTTPAKYKFRLPDGLPVDDYQGTVEFTVNDPDANIQNINLSGEVIEVDSFIIATGGITYDIGNERIHIFDSTEIFEIIQKASDPANNEITGVLIGGGASGGQNRQGAGGAGEFKPFSLSLNIGSFPVFIGAGAAGSIIGPGNNGSNSTFAGLTSYGGGRGGQSQQNGGNGANGGGSGNGGPGYFGGIGIPPLGFNGGNSPGFSSSAGGAGAGGPGGDNAKNGNDEAGGDGGLGVLSSITGVPKWYCGGGGGGGNSFGGIGGSGIGGIGGTALLAATSGEINTGSGGGSAYDPGPPANGSSGKCVIRYRFKL